MQTYIYIDNFRGFTEAFIPLRQVNFLVGENSTGKTSFLELIETLGTMPFWLFEPNFSVPGTQPRHFLDLVSAASSTRTSFTIGAVELGDTAHEKTSGMLVSYSNLDGRPVPFRVSVVQGGAVKTVDGKLWRARKGEEYRVRERQHASSGPSAHSATACLRSIRTVHSSGSGFSKHSLAGELEASPLFFRFQEFLFGVKDSSEREVKAPYPLMRNIVELAPIRTRPRRTYDAPQTVFSREGEHTPYVIKRRLTSRAHAEAFRSFLERAGQSSGLFESISVRPYGQGPRAPFEVRIVLGKAALGLENVGYGVSQAMPVIVELFVRPKRAAFAIQQPEVHLHPRAQATFGDLIAELSRSEDKCFLVETHSDFLIDRFRLNVRNNGSVPSQLLFFERTDRGNRAVPIPIEKDGGLCDTQPDAYRAFFLNESLAMLS